MPDPSNATENVRLTQVEIVALARAFNIGHGHAWNITAVEQIFAARVAQAKVDALNEAADAIQALHPGEIKNSVVFLRDRARTANNTNKEN